MSAEETIATLRLAYVRELRKRLAADAETLQKAYQDVGNQLGRKMAAQAELDTEVTRLEQEVSADHLAALATAPDSAEPESPPEQ